MTNVPVRRPIVIQTRRGNTIQCDPPQVELSPFERALCGKLVEDFRKQLPNSVEITERRGPTRSYNCHGLTFLSRRAWLGRQEALLATLRDDGYQRIALSDVLPGDIVLYQEQSGIIEHTGIVVWIDEQPSSRLPWIISKWGKCGEFLHPYNRSLYTGTPFFMREGY
jgi:hypothetical protein